MSSTAGDRRIISSVMKWVTGIVGVLSFFAVWGIAYGLLWAIFGGIAHGLFVNPKGFVGSLMNVWIPMMGGLVIAETVVLKCALRFMDRLDRWKTPQE